MPMHLRAAVARRLGIGLGHAGGIAEAAGRLEHHRVDAGGVEDRRQALPRPSEDEIREAISGNLCRCTGYQYIIKSIEWAAKHGAPRGVEVMP